MRFSITSSRLPGLLLAAALGMVIACPASADERTLRERVLGRPAAEPAEQSRASRPNPSASPSSAAAPRSTDRQAAREAGRDRETALPARRTVPDRLNDVIDEVEIRDATAEQTLEWFTQTTGTPLRFRWEWLEDEGLSRDTPITLRMSNVTAARTLGAILQELSPRETMIYEVSPFDIRIMTKRQANRFREIRLYDVAELLHFAGVREQTTIQGGSGFAQTDTFGRGPDTQSRRIGLDMSRVTGHAPLPPREVLADSLIELIQVMIEPEVWDTRGGDSVIRYFRGQLIISAPAYVHEQIGDLPSAPTGRRLSDPAPSSRRQPIELRGREERIIGFDSPSMVSTGRFTQVIPRSRSDQRTSTVRPPDVSSISGVQGDSSRRPTPARTPANVPPPLPPPPTSSR